jgi:hypothetical protein
MTNVFGVEVGVGGTVVGVDVGGTAVGVDVGGAVVGVDVGGIMVGVDVGGIMVGVDVGGIDVGVVVGSANAPPQPANTNTANVRTSICWPSFILFLIFVPFVFYGDSGFYSPWIQLVSATDWS